MHSFALILGAMTLSIMTLTEIIKLCFFITLSFEVSELFTYYVTKLKLFHMINQWTYTKCLGEIFVLLLINILASAAVWAEAQIWTWWWCVDGRIFEISETFTYSVTKLKLFDMINQWTYTKCLGEIFVLLFISILALAAEWAEVQIWTWWWCVDGRIYLPAKTWNFGNMLLLGMSHPSWQVPV
jgi:hypothetical protein